MTRPFVDVMFGFKTKIDLSDEDMEILDAVGIHASPLIYTMEDTPTEFIVGKLISSLRESGECANIKFDSSQDAQDKMKAEIFKALDEAGFDVKDKNCELTVNNYYY